MQFGWPNSFKFIYCLTLLPFPSALFKNKTSFINCRVRVIKSECFLLLRWWTEILHNSYYLYSYSGYEKKKKKKNLFDQQTKDFHKSTGDISCISCGDNLALCKMISSSQVKQRIWRRKRRQAVDVCPFGRWWWCRSRSCDVSDLIRPGLDYQLRIRCLLNI